MTRQELPVEFTDRMQKMLREESEAFFASYEVPAARALRFNPLKVQDPEATAELYGLNRSIPWEECGYYYTDAGMPGEGTPFGKHPHHEAGVYYIQEPSAMAPVSFLNVGENERILDLCAAPGGKSTQIAGKMKGTGILVVNEPHAQRARILAQNMERLGVGNAMVTNELPDRLAEHFPLYFDKILVDAPCSGEGMFKKNPEACEQWSVENVYMCANRQDEILSFADRMLRVGGRLVYSTCTFETEEDEGVIRRFLDTHPEYKICSVPLSDGMVLGEDGTIRLWPHKVQGEGHFAAVLTKGVESSSPGANRPAPNRRPKSPGKREIAQILDFAKRHLQQECLQRLGLTERSVDPTAFLCFGERIFLLPVGFPSTDGLKVLRAGLELGSFHKDRFEPAHALAHGLKMTDTVNHLNLQGDSEAARQYLNGQEYRINTPFNKTSAVILNAADAEISLTDPAAPWTLVCVDSYPLGWSKYASGVFKNHYPKGLRIPI
ncbi:MAG: RsmB/NOP family class I SAM-dependent RNA methyltransferase [Lachnospiraceae bacterium]|nr:RsmB/NOP family class I SAM-dependent RNA methyltransferase [Lachnospiraceae bacterium]